jgi:hypothetical protein
MACLFYSLKPLTSPTATAGKLSPLHSAMLAFFEEAYKKDKPWQRQPPKKN